MNHAQLQVRKIRKDIFCIMIGDACRDDADLGTVQLHFIFRKGFGKIPEKLHPFFHLDAAGSGIDWNHHIFGGIDLDAGFILQRLRFFY